MFEGRMKGAAPPVFGAVMVVMVLFSAVCCDCAEGSTRSSSLVVTPPPVDGPHAGWADGDAGPSASDSRLASEETPEGGPSLLPATRISAAGENTCATLADGTARCWGRMVTSEFGLDVPSGIAPAVPLPSSVGLASVWVGRSSVCAVTKNGAVRIWGKLDGPDAQSSPSRSIPGLANVSMLAGGES